MAASVGEALLEKDPVPLAGLPRFVGAGIYAIYYVGDFPSYAALSAANRNGNWAAPIYVGKAIPPGGRKGLLDPGTTVGPVLWGRLGEHAESVRAASTTLNIEDFYCRHLVVEDIWIPLGESLMISRFAPVWNTMVDGFGNHDPGTGRYNGFCPRWDVLHPGRVWATRCKPRPETQETIAREVFSHLDGRVFPTHRTLFR